MVVGVATLSGCVGMWRYRRFPCLPRDPDDDRVQLLAEASSGVGLSLGSLGAAGSGEEGEAVRSWWSLACFVASRLTVVVVAAIGGLGRPFLIRPAIT